MRARIGLLNLLVLGAVVALPGPLFAGAGNARLRFVCTFAYDLSLPQLAVATPDDRQAIIDFIAGQRSRMGLDPNNGADGRSLKSDLEAFENYYDGANGRVFLLKDEGRIYGTSALTRIDESTGEIKKVYVDDSLKRLGAGRRLIEASVDEARHRGFDRIVLQTQPLMARAIELYEGFGFQLNPARSTSTVLYYELHLATSTRN